MYRLRSIAAVAAFAALAAAPAFADSMMSGSMMGMKKDPMVGGAAMYPNKTIVANAVNSKDHTVLVSLVKKAGLVATLSGPGPFTVFAPTNEAFAKLPKATVTKVTSNKKLLTTVLTYHVLAGDYDSKKIAAAIKAGGGTATFKTVAGPSIKASMVGGKLVLTDDHGDKSTVTIADVYQSNGVIHVINTVLVP
jgi:uncharacterized surface protein with fasciclin (FAS1) repeats